MYFQYSFEIRHVHMYVHDVQYVRSSWITHIHVHVHVVQRRNQEF